MDKIQKKDSGRRRIRGRRPWQPVILACLLVVCALLTGILAKYAYQGNSAKAQAVAENFYFTVDFLGDTVMLPQNDPDTYAFGDASTSGSWHLYGGAAHTIEIKVQNFYDEFRITQQNIKYTAAVDSASSQAGTILTEGTDSTQLTESGTLTGKTQSSDTITLKIPAYTSWKYGEDTIVTLTIASTSPYSKNYQMQFHLHPTDTSFQYRVVDTAESPYAELILMDNVMDAEGESTTVQPWIRWPESLEIDNSNNLTYTLVDIKKGIFHQQEGMEDRNMQVSEPFATGRSESIAFFKKDAGRNYSCGDTVVVPNEQGQYIIDLTGLTGNAP